MKRLFLVIFLGVMVAMALTGWVVSLIVSRDFDARIRSAPPPLGRVAAALASELFGQTAPEERQPLLDRVVAGSGLRMRLLAADEASQGDTCPFHQGNLCWGRRGHQHPPFDMSVMVDLPGGDQVLEITEARRFSPWTTSTWLLIVGTMLAVAIATGAVLALPVVRRLRRVQDTAERIEQGDLSARADVRSFDEVGVFAARFNRMAAKLQELVDGRSQMIQAVAHELRTPVSRVRFGVEMMADTDDPAAREARLREVVKDLEEQDRLIQELLLLIRYESGGSGLARSVFSPEDAVRAVVDRHRPLHPGKSLTLECGLASNVGLSAHRQSVEHAVANLLSNAMRHATGKVLCRLRCDGPDLLIEVEDDGPGIPEAERSRVLEPFYRLDRSRSRDSGGVGLGLAIVDRVARAHGASLDILDAEGGGALVRLRFPGPCPELPAPADEVDRP